MQQNPRGRTCRFVESFDVLWTEKREGCHTLTLTLTLKAKTLTPNPNPDPYPNPNPYPNSDPDQP